jgi:hypothetical protein
MNEHELSFGSTYVEQTDLAERELSSFIAAVKELYGSEDAALSANDWIDELKLVESLPRSEMRDWRAVTIAASVRLAGRTGHIAN